MSSHHSSTKKNIELTLIDKLSRLSYSQTLKLLGSDAPKLLKIRVLPYFSGEWQGRGGERGYCCTPPAVMVTVRVFPGSPSGASGSRPAPTTRPSSCAPAPTAR
jgi:hypothetical protein